LARGPEMKSRAIGRSIQLIIGITEIVDITKIASSNPQIRRRRDCSITLLMQRSGARSIVPQDTIWKSEKLFWITRRCHHQHRWHKNHIEAKIVEPILITRIRWARST
jgi:hypothetical protein